MTEDFEDEFTKTTVDEQQIESEVSKEIITANDGAMFKFFKGNSFYDHELTLNVKSSKHFKELINSMFEIGMHIKDDLTRNKDLRPLYPLFTLLNKNSDVLYGTLLPVKDIYPLDSIKNFLQQDNEKNLKQNDMSHILSMMEIKSHKCPLVDPTLCKFPNSEYKNVLHIQSINLEKPEKSLTFSMGYIYTEEGVDFDKHNIEVIPLSQSVRTGIWEDNSNRDSPYT